MRCAKNCACEECEHFMGQEVMQIENKRFSTLFGKYYNRVMVLLVMMVEELL